MVDTSRRKGDGKFISRKDFQAAEAAVTVDESDREIFDRLFTLFDKTGAGTVVLRDFVVGLAPITKGPLHDRLALAFDLFDIDSKGHMDAQECKMVFRSMNHTCSCMGDPTMHLDQLDELVETIFQAVDESLIERNRLKYAGAISEFCDHPIIEAFLDSTNGAK